MLDTLKSLDPFFILLCTVLILQAISITNSRSLDNLPYNYLNYCIPHSVSPMTLRNVGASVPKQGANTPLSIKSPLITCQSERGSGQHCQSKLLCMFCQEWEHWWWLEKTMKESKGGESQYWSTFCLILLMLRYSQQNMAPSVCDWRTRVQTSFPKASDEMSFGHFVSITLGDFALKTFVKYPDSSEVNGL